MYLTRPENYFVSDSEFDALYPGYLQKLSTKHWTPLKIAFSAARFLACQPSANIVDIGAGSGKFCIAGAQATSALFTGIEQNLNLVKAGNKVIRQLGMQNAQLIHNNFTQIDISQYTGIYFFNSFHENLVAQEITNDRVERSAELYSEYTVLFRAKLSAMAVGTRLATYYLSHGEVPFCYKLYDTEYKGLLKLWIKEY